MDECVEVLSASQAADQVLSEQAKLAHLLDEFETQISQHESIPAKALHEDYIRGMLKTYKTHLNDWRKNVPQTAWNSRSRHAPH